MQAAIIAHCESMWLTHDPHSSSSKPRGLHHVWLQAAGDAEGEDAVAKLEAALRPIEKYAVRLLEEVPLTPYHSGGFPRRIHHARDAHNTRPRPGAGCCTAGWRRCKSSEKCRIPFS